MKIVDPVAKACLPIYYKTYLDSREYSDTMHDRNRLIYNIIYRFFGIYVKSNDLNFQWQL